MQVRNANIIVQQIYMNFPQEKNFMFNLNNFFSGALNLKKIVSTSPKNDPGFIT